MTPIQQRPRTAAALPTSEQAAGEQAADVQPTSALPATLPTNAEPTGPVSITPAVPAMRPHPDGTRLDTAAPEPSRIGLPAPRTARATVVAALAAVVCGVLGLLVAPVLLGPAAIVGGFAAEHLARGGSRKVVAAVVLVAVVAGLCATLALR